MIVGILALPVTQSGCFMIGPDYVRPDVATSEGWIPTDGDVVRHESVGYAEWWRVFNDPVLDSLVDTAYRQNPTLQTAGARVLEAVARRGIAVGQLFPQEQEAFGAYTRVHASDNVANPVPDDDFDEWELGFDAFWELDVWGRLRRAVQAADEEALASIANYDDVLVSLIAEVATNYIALRTFEERLEVATANVDIQSRSFDIADERYRRGAESRLDASQAGSLLEETRALIPDLETGIRQTQNTLCILLGIPPRDLTDLLGGPRPIPTVPAQVAVGIPAELLRRRPDVRRAEHVLAAQSARIGIAKADYLPRFSLAGTIEVRAEDTADLFKGDSLEAFGGPGFRWAILNYGRITNNIRVEDAEYQALIGVYEDTILRAQAEVENSIASFLGTQRRAESLTRSVDWATTSVDIADAQYREGAADYTRVLDSQESLVESQDRLVTTRGEVALNLTSLYKALGGGWELRAGENFVSEEAAAEMRARTRWGSLLETENQAADAERVEATSEQREHWWQWLW